MREIGCAIYSIVPTAQSVYFLVTFVWPEKRINKDED